MKKINLLLLIIISVISLLADPPDWEQIGGTQFSMLLRTQVTHQGELFEGINENNILAAFGPGGETDCRAIGFWIEANPPLYENGFWDLGIVSNQFQNETISFKIYEAASDSVFDCYQTIEFTDGITIGSSVEPYMLSTSVGTLQGTIELNGEGDIEATIISAGMITTNPVWNPAGFWQYEMTLSPGTYDVQAYLFGFQGETISNVVIHPDQVTSGIDFSLEPVDYPMLYLPEELYGMQGGEIFVPLYIDIPENAGIEGINVIITFNSTILDATGATLTGSILEGQDYTFGVNPNNSGEIILGFSANDELYSGDGIVAFMFFDVDPEAEVGSQTELVFSEAEINEFQVPSASAILTVMDQLFEISGTINYYAAELPLDDVLLNLAGDHNLETETDAAGNYLINNIVEGNYILSAEKINDLGGLSGTDASRVFRHSISLYDFDCQEMIAADVTLDASISTTDASRIARYAAGLIDDLNEGIDWIFLPESIENCDEWPPIEFVSTRSFEPLDQNFSDQDFLGIRLGDVTGNWVENRIYPEFRDDPEAFLPEITAGIGETVTVPLTVNFMEDLESLDIRIEFDDNVISAADASLSGSVLEDDNYSMEFNNTEAGEITIIIYATSSLFTGSGIVAHIDFFIEGDVGDTSTLSFSQFDVNEIDFLGNTTDGNITIIETEVDDNIVPLKLHLSQNFPNPFSLNTLNRNSDTTILFELPADSFITLEIYNLKGSLINSLIREAYPAGRHTVSWDGRDLNNRQVSSGIYFYKLRTDKENLIRKMLILN